MTYIKAFFMGLGVVFFVLILIATYLFVVDPFNIKPLMSLLWSQNSATLEPSVTAPVDSSDENSIPTGATESSDTPESNTNASLSPAQAAALEGVGISPDSLPSSISPEQEACFIQKIGSDRVEAIKAGAAPSAAEIWQARECL